MSNSHCSHELTNIFHVSRKSRFVVPSRISLHSCGGRFCVVFYVAGSTWLIASCKDVRRRSILNKNAHLTQCSSNVHICAMFYSTWIKRVCSRKERGNSEFQSWIIVWRIYMKKTDDENCIFHGRVAYVICLNMSRNDVVYLDTLELYVFYGYRLDSRHFRKKKKWKRRFMMMNFFCWEYYSEWVLVKSRNARWKFMWKSYKTRASWHVFIFTFSQFIFVVSNEIN